MAYNELIKNVEKIREYIREFYVYGFKKRDDYDAKSGRSYDNERRRIESWLGDYISYRRDAAGKNVFLSVDSRQIQHNPLYEVFKAKSFTDKDITLHFYILDLLGDGESLSVAEIIGRIESDYLSHFPAPPEFDESTVRNKLKEYEALGLLSSEKIGRQLFFRLNDEPFDLDKWSEALTFFSEADPLGVVGSFMLDKLDTVPEYFVFKHHYIVNAMESEILLSLLTAIEEKRRVRLKIRSSRRGRPAEFTVFPVKIYSSVQSGRQHLLAYNYHFEQIRTFRIDTIRDIKLLEEDLRYSKIEKLADETAPHLWGVSIPWRSKDLDHLEMTIVYDENEQHIPARLEREKRCGHTEIIDEGKILFTADILDAEEMIPWIRTFTGRIAELKCSNEIVVETFYSDFEQMAGLYGGCENAVL